MVTDIAAVLPDQTGNIVSAVTETGNADVVCTKPVSMIIGCLYLET